MNCGFVGILGLPNVGKSSLFNEILQDKISIVSPKPQTTRQSLSGICTTDDYQLIFWDAPGFVNPKKGIFDFLAKEFDRVIENSDILLIVIACDQLESLAFQQALAKAKKSKKPLAYLFTKADLPLSPYVAEFRESLDPRDSLVFDFSIKGENKKENLETILSTLAEQLPESPQPLYDPDMISLDKTRDIVAEFIREACFELLQQEIPFGLGVIIKSFKHDQHILRIEANILVEKENHKAIVIGKKGSQLKEIGKKAREQIEKFLGEKVFLGLHVAYKKNWQKDSNIMKELGYDDRRR